MDEEYPQYPSNSHKSNKLEPVEKLVEDVEKSDKVSKIIEGEVIRRKKPLRKRFMETFFGGDIRNVRSFIMFEVLLPAAKDAIADSVSQGIEKTLWGESRSTNRRSRSSYYGENNYTSYNRFMKPDPRQKRTDEFRGIGPAPSRRARANHDFDEIILATRVEAEEVIDRMFNLVQKYEAASVADLYDMLGVSSDYTDRKWGWTDLRSAGVTRISNGYLLDLPRAEPLD